MISKKLSAKKLFGRLLKQEFIRKIWAEGIVIIILIFSLPVNVALELGQYSKQLYDMPESVLMDFMLHNTTLLALSLLLGVFIALIEFGYLFQRNKVDFYHSLPVSRSMQFLYRYLSGLLLFLVPYTILYGVSILVGIAHGALVIGYLKDLAVFLLVYLLFFCALYSLSVIAVQLAGSYLSAIVAVMIVHFTGPFFCLLIRECQESFFRTYLDSGKPPIFGRGSVFTICLKTLEDYAHTGFFDTFTILILILLAVLLPFGGYALFLKRPAEKNSCGLAFPVVGPIFRFLAVMGSGMVMGIVLRSMSYSNDDFWLFFGLVAGCIVMHCIMQMILQMNFRAFFRGKLSLLLCTGLAVLAMCVFRYDLIGYDSYLPEADQVDFAGVSIDDLEYYRNYIRECTAQEYDRMIANQEVFSMVSGDEDECEVLSQMNLKNVQPVLNLANKSIEDDAWQGYDGNMQVCFRLKNGRHIFRQYRIDLWEGLSDCAEIFAMDRFKEAVYPILTRGEENTTVWLNNNYSGTKQKVTLQDTRFINLLRTYKRELKELDLMTLTKEEPLLTMEFTESQVDCFNSYPVYPSFEHTLTLLKGYGYEFKPMTDSLYKIQAIYNNPEDELISEYLNIEEWSSQASENLNTVWIDDKKQLKKLIPYLIPDVYYDSNLTLKPTEPGYYITGYLNDKLTGEEIIMGFVIEKGKVPDFLKTLEENAKNQY